MLWLNEGLTETETLGEIDGLILADGDTEGLAEGEAEGEILELGETEGEDETEIDELELGEIEELSVTVVLS